jgi:hypothetical protein
MPFEGSRVAEHPGGGDGQVHRELRGEVPVGETANSVGSEKTTHSLTPDARYLRKDSDRTRNGPPSVRFVLLDERTLSGPIPSG